MPREVKHHKDSRKDSRRDNRREEGGRSKSGGSSSSHRELYKSDSDGSRKSRGSDKSRRSDKSRGSDKTDSSYVTAKSRGSDRTDRTDRTDGSYITAEQYNDEQYGGWRSEQQHGEEAYRSEVDASNSHADGLYDLRRTRFGVGPVPEWMKDPGAQASFGERSQELVPEFSGRTGDPVMDSLSGRVADINLRRMIDNTGNASSVLDRPAILQLTNDRVVTNSFDPVTNRMNIMDTRDSAQVHETSHAANEGFRGNPQFKLADEYVAFAKQWESSMRRTSQGPKNFDGRTPYQMAQSYEGKETFPGTLEESLRASRTNVERGQALLKADKTELRARGGERADPTWAQHVQQNEVDLSRLRAIENPAPPNRVSSWTYQGSGSDRYWERDS